MMLLSVSLSADGCLERLQATGHVDGPERGANLACAAATALVRTAGEVLHARAGIHCSGTAPVEGVLELELEPVPPASAEWVRGVTDFLLWGCTRLQTEAGGALAVQVLRRG
jgi:uncharacterized protein YsxB (DUF464 family)